MLKRVAILALVGLSLACAKNYSFTLYDAGKAGKAELRPGEYHVSVDGSDMVMTDKNGKQIDTAGTIDVAEKRYSSTSIYYSKQPDGTQRIQWIELGGSRNKIVFEDRAE